MDTYIYYIIYMTEFGPSVSTRDLFLQDQTIDWSPRAVALLSILLGFSNDSVVRDTIWPVGILHGLLVSWGLRWTGIRESLINSPSLSDSAITFKTSPTGTCSLSNVVQSLCKPQVMHARTAHEQKIVGTSTSSQSGSRQPSKKKKSTYTNWNTINNCLTSNRGPGNVVAKGLVFSTARPMVPCFGSGKEHTSFPFMSPHNSQFNP